MCTFAGVTFGESCPFLGLRGYSLLLRVGQAASPLVGYPPLADPVHELQDCHHASLETRFAGSTAAQCMWLVLREFSPKY